MQKFIDDDVGYRAWTTAASNTGGFVVNCHRTPVPGYLMLHRVDCSTITRLPANGAKWTGPYIKICSCDVVELEQWANQQVGGRLRPCGTCKPMIPLPPVLTQQGQVTISSNINPLSEQNSVSGGEIFHEKLPFASYPHQGRVLLGRVRGANCRHEYGLAFMRKTGQTQCAYCGVDFTDSYEKWLTMALDHVVPTSVGKGLCIPIEWTEDCANKVLACAACNSFHNRYKPSNTLLCPQSLAEFFDLRDVIFVERKQLIAARHISERAFFDQALWKIK
jgi:hypothetical protein